MTIRKDAELPNLQLIAKTQRQLISRIDGKKKEKIMI